MFINRYVYVYVFVFVFVDVDVHLSCLVLSRLVWSGLVLSCPVGLVFLCCVVSCVWRCLSLCVSVVYLLCCLLSPGSWPVSLFVCILCCKETDDDQVPS